MPLTLTPMQKQISTCVSTTLSELPVVLSDLVSQYAVDFTVAESRLEYNRKNRLQNPAVVAHIKDALISCECDPQIKRGIFQLAQDWGYKPQLNRILTEIRQQGYRINLDGVDLSNLNLTEYDLRGMSAVGANFSHSKLDDAQLDMADLTGVVVISASLERVGLVGATLYKACISDSNLKGARLNRVIACGMVIVNVNTEDTTVTSMVSDNAEMRAIVVNNLQWTPDGGMVSKLSMTLFDENHYREKFERNRLCIKSAA